MCVYSMNNPILQVVKPYPARFIDGYAVPILPFVFPYLQLRFLSIHAIYDVENCAVVVQDVGKNNEVAVLAVARYILILIVSVKDIAEE